MSAIWVSVCSMGALAATGGGAACALAGLRGAGRTPFAVPVAAVMALSTTDMVVPGLRLLPAVAWAAVLLGAALVGLLDRGHRVSAAHHAAGLLIMAVMWVAMLPSAGAAGPAGPVAGPGTGSDALAASSSSGASAMVAAAHGGHGAAFAVGDVTVGWFVLAASVALMISVVRAAAPWHRPPRHIGAAWRWEVAQHLSMALAMAAMAAAVIVSAAAS